MDERKASDMAIQQLPLGAEPVKRPKRGQRVLVRDRDGKLKAARVSSTDVSPYVNHLVSVWVRFDSQPAYEQGVALENVFTLPEGV